METIKSYLDSMFRSLPLTDKVIKAKSELLQMMEDKYTELIKEGKSENEAVGEVISNFGNLDELAKTLGIEDILYSNKQDKINRHKLSFEEVNKYIEAKFKAIRLTTIAISLCIMCFIPPILAHTANFGDRYGVLGMFVMLGIAIALFIVVPNTMEQWKYIKHEPCAIDSVTIDQLKERKSAFITTYSIKYSLGVLLCVLCFVPSVFLDSFENEFINDLGGAFFFIFISVGVYLIVTSTKMKKNYDHLININNATEFKAPKKSDSYKNPNLKSIMSIYWSVVLCIYLCISFLTFRWDISWLIWPVAGVGTIILKAMNGEEV